MKISTVQQMREMDQQSVTEYGITEEVLMENAGAAAFTAIQQEFGVKDKSFLIICGVGNNGGDGLVVTRKLHSNRAEVQILIIGDPAKFSGPAKLNYAIIVKLKIKVLLYEQIKNLPELINRHQIIVDGIFGTGLDREVEGDYKAVIAQINASGKKVVSLDIPSGIQGDTGQIMGTAVRANVTITFGLPKTGNLLYPGFEHGGKLFVTHISFPPALHGSDKLQIQTNDPVQLPGRKRDAHKGDCGKVLFIAGSSNYLGAPYFAAQSFLKTGGGLSFLATAETIAGSIGGKGCEIIFVPQKTTVQGNIAMENKKALLEFSEQVDLVVLGPGVSLQEETQQLVRDLVVEIRKPLLIDGDGITAVAQDPSVLRKRKVPTLLTPHPGEMSRLAKTGMEELQSGRIRILQKVTAELNSFIVLKGAHSLIGYPDGRVFLNLSGNPGMATAGSGDVLTGAIAAMHGLGLPLEDALRMGVFVHGLAGDLAAGTRGEDGLVAGDIMEHLPAAMKLLRTQFESVYENYYQTLFLI